MVAKKRTSPRRSRLSCCSPRWYMIRRTARGRWNYARDTKVSESSEYSELTSTDFHWKRTSPVTMSILKSPSTSVSNCGMTIYVAYSWKRL